MLQIYLIRCNYKLHAGHLDENWHQSLVTLAGSSETEAFNQEAAFAHSARHSVIDSSSSNMVSAHYKPGILQIPQHQQALNLQVIVIYC